MYYFTRVRGYINGFTRSGDTAGELAQEVFTRLWENNASVKPSIKSLASYLFTIAYRVTIDSLRSQQVRKTYHDEQAGRPEEVSFSIEEDYIARETSSLLEQVVDHLPARQQEIFRMSRQLGLSNDEIAERLVISKRTVENQLSLALKRLKGVFNARGNEKSVSRP